MQGIIDFLTSANILFEENVDGKRLCSFHVGGTVRLVVKPKNAEQLTGLYAYLNENNIENIILGKGSNIVINDDGFDGVVVLLSEFDTLELYDDKIISGAGVSMFKLANFAQKNGLSGLEFAHGIPGSVGGGVYMNAGAYGGEISYVLESCYVIDMAQGRMYALMAEHCNLSYRHSIFMDNKDLVVMYATFSLKKGNPDEIKAKMDEYRAKRSASQPLEYPSAGSTFKRPEGHFAGKLIEDCGLKGFAIGGAQVSEKHAGFVINRGGATCEDIKNLVEHIQKTVKEKFNVSLECEMEFI